MSFNLEKSSIENLNKYVGKNLNIIQNENRIEVEEKFFVYNIEEIEKIAKLNKFCVKDFF